MSVNTDVFHRAVDRWNAGDLEGYLGLYAPAIRLYGYAPQPFDKAAVGAFYRAIWASLPVAGRVNPLLEIHDRIEAQDKLVCRFTMAGVHAGPFMNVLASGRPYRLDGITILRFEAGQVIERWSCADMLGLLVQIGALPAP